MESQEIAAVDPQLRAALLGLDDTSLMWRRLVCEMAHMLNRATLVGNPAPYVKRVSERIRHPQVGDYVVETSTFYRGRGEDGPVDVEHQSGFLEKHDIEPTSSYTDEDWIADGNELPRPTEEVWYIRYGPGDDDVTRWHNADFLVVPLDRSTLEEMPAAYRDEDGAVVFTRDSLIGSLADMGFDIRPREGV